MDNSNNSERYQDDINEEMDNSQEELSKEYNLDSQASTDAQPVDHYDNAGEFFSHIEKQFSLGAVTVPYDMQYENDQLIVTEGTTTHREYIEFSQNIPLDTEVIRRDKIDNTNDHDSLIDELLADEDEEEKEDKIPDSKKLSSLEGSSYKPNEKKNVPLENNEQKKPVDKKESLNQKKSSNGPKSTPNNRPVVLGSSLDLDNGNNEENLDNFDPIENENTDSSDKPEKEPKTVEKTSEKNNLDNSDVDSKNDEDKNPDSLDNTVDSSIVYDPTDKKDNNDNTSGDNDNKNDEEQHTISDRPVGMPSPFAKSPSKNNTVNVLGKQGKNALPAISLGGSKDKENDVFGDLPKITPFGNNTEKNEKNEDNNKNFSYERNYPTVPAQQNKLNEKKSDDSPQGNNKPLLPPIPLGTSSPVPSASPASGNAGKAAVGVGIIVLPFFLVFILIAGIMGGSGGAAFTNQPKVVANETCMTSDGMQAAEDNNGGDNGPGAPSVDGLAIPAEGTFTSLFNDPTRGKHLGIDIANSEGTPMYAAHDGVVIRATSGCGRGYRGNTCGGGFGNHIYLQSSEKDSLVTRYAHSSKLLVKEGDKVKAGQRIALMGSSGDSSGDHLHFEVLNNGQQTDPAEWFRKQGVDFPGKLGTVTLDLIEKKSKGKDRIKGTNNSESLPIDNNGKKIVTVLPVKDSGYDYGNVQFSEKNMKNPAIKYARTLAREFPELEVIGGWRPYDPYPDHPSGLALDVMIPKYNTPEGKKLGDTISEMTIDNYEEIQLEYFIWRQASYYPPEFNAKTMGDRGGDTANHMDHLHIKFVNDYKDTGKDPYDIKAGKLSSSSGTGDKSSQCCANGSVGQNDIANDDADNETDVGEKADEYAADIIRMGKEKGMSDEDIQAAIALAMGSSQMRNLANDGSKFTGNGKVTKEQVQRSADIDHDGIHKNASEMGLFLMTPGKDGDVKDLMDTNYQINKVLDGIKSKGGTKGKDLNTLAKDIGLPKYDYNEYKDQSKELFDNNKDDSSDGKGTSSEKSMPITPRMVQDEEQAKDQGDDSESSEEENEDDITGGNASEDDEESSGADTSEIPEECLTDNTDTSKMSKDLKTDEIPPEYVDLIIKAANDTKNITPPMLAAILYIESNFNPKASSGVANGIAQFTPATWATWGKGGNVWDPKDAIPAAARFLDHLYDHAIDVKKKNGGKGDPELELMAASYNGGPGSIMAQACGTPARVPNCGNPADFSSYAGQTYPYAKKKFPDAVKKFSK